MKIKILNAILMKSRIKNLGYSKIKKSYFINGKRKNMFVEYMDGIPINEWYLNNMDEITAFQDGHFELLDNDNNKNFGLEIQPESTRNKFKDIPRLFDEPPF